MKQWRGERFGDPPTYRGICTGGFCDCPPCVFWYFLRQTMTLRHHSISFQCRVLTGWITVKVPLKSGVTIGVGEVGD